MTRTAYRVVLRLRSPLHIGQGKVGNIQLTRPYVTGRVLWGALTERLTRDNFQGRSLAPKQEEYLDMGERVNKHLAFTYFYPALEETGEYKIHWPWREEEGDEEGKEEKKERSKEDESAFRARFLSSYVGTALVYPRHSAAEGTLHEIEFLSPHTLGEESKPVFLVGYIFADEEAPTNWQTALSRLQIGGERGYGWGRVEPVEGMPDEWKDKPIFDSYELLNEAWPPRLQAKEDTHLLAHALATDFGDEHRAVSGVDGPVEPLVGRETRKEGRFGMCLSQARICYTPGSRVKKGTTVKVGDYGIWEAE